MRTLLNPYQLTPLYSIYVCNDVIRNVPVQGRFKNAYTVEYIHDATAKDLAACSNFVIIIVYNNTAFVNRSRGGFLHCMQRVT